MKNMFLISLIFVVGAFAQVHSVIPKNTESKVRTDTAIPGQAGRWQLIFGNSQPGRTRFFGGGSDPPKQQSTTGGGK